MALLAHRGMTANSGDNSAGALTAVVAAVAQGFQIGIETDIREIVDDLILNHDPFEEGVPLFKFRYAELQQALGERCPLRLSDAMQLMADVPLINLELKEKGHTQRSIEMALRHCETTGAPISKFVFSSFIPEVTYEVKALDDRFMTGMLIEGNLDSTRPTAEHVCLTLDDAPSDLGVHIAETMWQVADGVGADFLNPHWTHLNRDVFLNASSRGKKLVPWTVNNVHLLPALMVRPEVEHIVTDFPELAYQEIRSTGHHRKQYSHTLQTDRIFEP